MRPSYNPAEIDFLTLHIACSLAVSRMVAQIEVSQADVAKVTMASLPVIEYLNVVE